MPDLDIDALRAWIGHEETRTDIISAAVVERMAAALDRPRPPAPGDPLPPFWHWLFCLPATPASQTGVDGHATRGGFLPPVPLPRRMWAGSRVSCPASPRIGDAIRRRSRVADVMLREGRSGPLVFVTVVHEIDVGSEPALREEQDLVYRGLPAAGQRPAPPKPAPAQAQWNRVVSADPVLLFRYSALTFNSHRIHYDRSYAVGVEGYPGLVVHGPLTATLLLELLAHERPAARVGHFAFRALRPLFDNAAFMLHGRADGDSALLWALDADGTLAMTLEAGLVTDQERT